MLLFFSCKLCFLWTSLYEFFSDYVNCNRYWLVMIICIGFQWWTIFITINVFARYQLIDWAHPDVVVESGLTFVFKCLVQCEHVFNCWKSLGSVKELFDASVIHVNSFVIFCYCWSLSCCMCGKTQKKLPCA